MTRRRLHEGGCEHAIGLSPGQRDRSGKNQEVIAGFLRKELQETDMKRCLVHTKGTARESPVMGTSEACMKAPVESAFNIFHSQRECKVSLLCYNISISVFHAL